MPAKTASLKITDAYRVRMVAIRDQAKKYAKAAWDKIDLHDIDGTYRPAVLALQVAELQRGAARLGAAYVTAFVASELEQNPKLPAALAFQVGQSYGGRKLRAAFQQPAIAAKTAIGEGTPASQALREAGDHLQDVAGLATDTAARDAQRREMDLNTDVIGWKRAIRGTCDLCAGAADGTTVPAGTPLEIHPNCQCVAEPLVTHLPANVLRPGEQGARPDGMFFRDLTEKESHSLFQYLGPGYSDMNGLLRTGEFPGHYLESGAKAESHIKNIDKAFTKVMPLEKSKTVLRTTDDYKGLKVGDTVLDKGFVSTSTREDLGFGPDKVIIDLPAGTKVIDIEGNNREISIASHANEKEWLLPRSSKFVVTRVETKMVHTFAGQDRPQRVVHMKLVHQRKIPPRLPKPEPVPHQPLRPPSQPTHFLPPLGG